MLNSQQLESFHKNGYLVVERVLDDDDLQPVQREYDELLNSLAKRLTAAGEIEFDYAGMPFDERFARVAARHPGCIDLFNISLPLENGEINPDRYLRIRGLRCSACCTTRERWI